MVTWQGLRIRHIECRARNHLHGESFGERLMIEGPPATDVDEVGGVFHEREFLLADHASSALGDGQCQCHKIRLCEEIRKCRVGRDTISFWFSVAAEVENGHAEAEVSTPSYLVADVAHSHDAERFSRDIAADKKAWLEGGEVMSPGIAIAGNDVTGDRNHQAYGRREHRFAKRVRGTGGGGTPPLASTPVVQFSAKFLGRNGGRYGHR